MRIWVDADACPNVIKDILFRAAERAKVTLTLVANQPLRTPPSQYIRSVQVPAGFDAADNRIVELGGDPSAPVPGATDQRRSDLGVPVR